MISLYINVKTDIDVNSEVCTCIWIRMNPMYDSDLNQSFKSSLQYDPSIDGFLNKLVL